MRTTQPRADPILVVAYVVATAVKVLREGRLKLEYDNLLFPGHEESLRGRRLVETGGLRGDENVKKMAETR
jgi:hypothetical protein